MPRHNPTEARWINLPLYVDEHELMESLADKLETSVPDVVGLAVRLLAELKLQGAVRMAGDDGRFVVARCRDRHDVPGVYRRVFF